MDGNRDSDYFTARSCSVTQETTPVWWMVDMEEDVTVTNVIITSRDEGSRLKLLFPLFIFHLFLQPSLKKEIKM